MFRLIQQEERERDSSDDTSVKFRKKEIDFIDMYMLSFLHITKLLTASSFLTTPILKAWRKPPTTFVDRLTQMGAMRNGIQIKGITMTMINIRLSHDADFHYMKK